MCSVRVKKKRFFRGNDACSEFSKTEGRGRTGQRYRPFLSFPPFHLENTTEICSLLTAIALLLTLRVFSWKTFIMNSTEEGFRYHDHWSLVRTEGRGLSLYPADGNEPEQALYTHSLCRTSCTNGCYITPCLRDAQASLPPNLTSERHAYSFIQNTYRSLAKILAGLLVFSC